VPPGHEKLAQYFSCSGLSGVVFLRKHVGISYVEHMCLHPVGYAGHVVHSGASGA
jgi:hypothetical protein